jgi:hypothetical protein
MISKKGRDDYSHAQIKIDERVIFNFVLFCFLKQIDNRKFDFLIFFCVCIYKGEIFDSNKYIQKCDLKSHVSLRTFITSMTTTHSGIYRL